MQQQHEFTHKTRTVPRVELSPFAFTRLLPLLLDFVEIPFSFESILDPFASADATLSLH
jgi:hypothetical protein